MRLPGNFKILEEVDLQEGKIQAEATASRQQHSQKKEEGEYFSSNEERLRARKQEQDERRILQGEWVDLGRLRTADFRCIKRIGVIPSLSERAEVLVEAQKEAVRELAEHFKETVPFESNLTELEQAGREEIVNGVEEGKWVHGMTDKSKKQCLDTVENHRRAQGEHSGGDAVVDMAVVQEAEKVLTQNSIALCKAFNVGVLSGESDKIISSLKVEDGGVPCGETLRKDHKKNWDRILGPKSRLLVNGKRGPNATFANLSTRILRPLRMEAEERGN